MIVYLKMYIVFLTKILPVIAMGAKGSHEENFGNWICGLPRI